MKPTHVDGENRGKILLYALSTCVWCGKTKEFLETNNVAYDYINVDLLEGDERSAAIADLKKWNRATSLPTMIVNDETAIIGFKTDQIKEVLGL